MWRYLITVVCLIAYTEAACANLNDTDTTYAWWDCHSEF